MEKTVYQQDCFVLYFNIKLERPLKAAVGSEKHYSSNNFLLTNQGYRDERGLRMEIFFALKIRRTYLDCLSITESRKYAWENLKRRQNYQIESIWDEKYGLMLLYFREHCN